MSLYMDQSEVKIVATQERTFSVVVEPHLCTALSFEAHLAPRILSFK